MFPRIMDNFVGSMMDIVRDAANSKDWPVGSEMAKAKAFFDKSNSNRYGMSVSMVKCFEEMGMPEIVEAIREPSEIEGIIHSLGVAARRQIEKCVLKTIDKSS